MKLRFLPPHPVLALSFSLAALCLGSIPGRAAVIFSDDFESYADIAAAGANYNIAGTFSSNPSWSMGSTTGLDASQAPAYAGGDAGFIQKVNSVDLTQGTAVVELYFFLSGSSGAVGTSGPQIGLLTANNGNFTGGGDLSGRLTGSTLQLRSTNSAILTGSSLTLDGGWYFMRFSATRTGTQDVFALSVELYKSGSGADPDDGSIGALVGSISAQATNAALYADTSLWAGMRISSSRFTGFDNLSLSQVPEPGAAGLTAIAALAFLPGLARRRRR